MRNLTKLPLTLATAFFIAACASKYPNFKRMDTVDVYGDVKVADPYRGLEEIDSPATKAWIAAQNKMTQRVLDTLPSRAALKARMTELWNFERFGVSRYQGLPCRGDALRICPVCVVPDCRGDGGTDLADEQIGPVQDYLFDNMGRFQVEPKRPQEFSQLC